MIFGSTPFLHGFFVFAQLPDNGFFHKPSLPVYSPV
jgi:hypothetical protein